MERGVLMGYRVTTTAPETRSESLRNEAARRVYEELLRYKEKVGENACGGTLNDGNLRAAKR